MQRLLRGVDPVVFFGSVGITLAFSLWGVLGTDSLASVMGSTLSWFLANFGWGFILIGAGALLLSLFFMLSPRYGNIRLGPDDSRPEFTTVSWIAMMFAAGLGLGLMFYGISEPITHFAAPPHGEAVPRTQDAAEVALRYTYFHWGFNGWALYAVMGLALAYWAFRRNTGTNLVSGTLVPLLGERASERPIGRTVDMLAIFATLFGTATSLGLGALQINSGLNFLTGLTTSNGVAIAIIAVITVLFVLSAVSGVEKGVQFLGNLNGGLTILLMVFFLVVGPTVLIIGTGIETIGRYIIQVIPMSFTTGVGGDEEWMASWTIFYWAWWISWAPFVGTFVARISRGRTIREFVLGVVAAPTGMGFIWFAIVGTAGINLQTTGQADLIGTVATPELSLFTALEALPLTTVASAISVFVIALFFISGADAASVVMSTMASRGALEPPKVVTGILGALMGTIASALLLVGGLTGLQQGAVLASVPFMVVIVLVAWCLFKALRADTAESRESARTAGPPVAVGPGAVAIEIDERRPSS
jgi:glycine betaine transporter